MIVTLDDSLSYKAFLDDKEIAFNERNKGCLEFTFDKNVKSGILKIQAK
jgi:hypothetical protein